MKCPLCSEDKLIVTDSRPLANSVRRRRRCEGCGHRFSTYEVTLPEELLCERTDGTEVFHRDGPARLLELLDLFGRLPMEDARLLLVLGRKLAGEEFNSRVQLERVA